MQFFIFVLLNVLSTYHSYTDCCNMDFALKCPHLEADSQSLQPVSKTNVNIQSLFVEKRFYFKLTRFRSLRILELTRLLYKFYEKKSCTNCSEILKYEQRHTNKIHTPSESELLLVCRLLSTLVSRFSSTSI